MKTQVSFTTDPSRKREAEQIANRLGMSLSTALNLFLVQMNYRQGLPFKVTLPKKTSNLKQMKSEIIKLTKQRPKEIVKTDGHGHVINPKECPDFMKWMKNG